MHDSTKLQSSGLLLIGTEYRQLRGMIMWQTKTRRSKTPRAEVVVGSYNLRSADQQSLGVENNPSSAAVEGD